MSKEKETLEEVAKKYRKTTPNQMFGDELGFIAGAKWQQERSYSDEEVLDILQKRLLSVGLFPSPLATQIWFKQFKK